MSQIGGIPLQIKGSSRYLSASQAFVQKQLDDTSNQPPAKRPTTAERKLHFLDNSETHFFLFFTDAMVILRPLQLAEQIFRHVLHKNFSLALHLCQKYKRLQSAMEVANEFACHLWEQNQHFKVCERSLNFNRTSISLSL